MADERARGLFVSIRPINGETKFSPTPPAPPPVGPALLCPYVLVSPTDSFFGEFDSWDFTDGTLTATTNGTDGPDQVGMAPDDATRISGSMPSGLGGDSAFQTIAPNNGRIAFEGVITSYEPGNNNSYQLSIATGDFFAGNYSNAFLTILPFSSEPIRYELGGAGARHLIPDQFSMQNPPGGVPEGARAAVVIDTDSGAVDLVSSYGHENFGGVPVMDLTDGAGILVAMRAPIGFPISSETYTKASDMQLPMPAGTTDSCLNPVSNVLTAYPLDASEAEIIAAGVTGKLSNPSLAQQRGEYTIPATPPAEIEQYSMSPEFTPSNVLDVSSGKVAIEWEASLPNFAPTDTPQESTILIIRGEVISAATTQPLMSPVLWVSNSNGRFSFCTGPSGDTFPDGTLVGTTVRLGLLIDNDTGKWRFWANGVEQSFGEGGLDLPDLSAGVILINSVVRLTVDDNGAAGQTASIRLITDPYFFTTPFPVGAVDIAGKAV